MRIALAVTTLVALLSTTPVTAAPRAPTAKWVVDFDDAQCVALRNYGTEAKPLLLVLKQPIEGDIMLLAVIRKGAGSTKYAEQSDGKIRFDNGPAIPSSMIKFNVKARGERVISTTVPLAQFNAARTAQTLTFSAGLGFDETFQLSSVEPLMKVMNACVADLRRIWNAGAIAPVSKPPEGTLSGVIRPEDYPAAALASSKSGRVEFIILVNEAGRIADCTVIETSGVAALDAQSCALITERARFRPAIGVDGKPAKSTWRQRITWQLRE